MYLASKGSVVMNRKSYKAVYEYHPDYKAPPAGLKRFKV